MINALSTRIFSDEDILDVDVVARKGKEREERGTRAGQHGVLVLERNAEEAGSEEGPPIPGMQHVDNARRSSVCRIRGHQR